MSRLLARIQRAELERQQAAAVADALRETGQRITAPRGAPADPARLRGIPMIGGAAGAIPGTMPPRNRRLDGWSGRP